MFRYYIYEVFTSNTPTNIWSVLAVVGIENMILMISITKIDYFDTAAVTTPIAPVRIHFVKT